MNGWVFLICIGLGAAFFIGFNDALLYYTDQTRFKPSLAWFYQTLQAGWLLGSMLFIVGISGAVDLAIKENRRNGKDVKLA